MARLDVIRDLATISAEVVDLLDAATVADGHRPLSDQLWLDLAHGGRPGALAVIARDEAATPVAYAQSSAGNDRAVVQLVVHPDHRHELPALGVEVLHTLGDELASDGADDVTWWVADPADEHADVAAALGWRAERRLHLMRRSLPTGAAVEIATRPFRPGADDEAWLAVNNRAFSEHGEQGGWDLATLHQRMAEPWFDAEGFLVHERDGRMAGFCWTKLHHELDPVEGEIYVIAVDPDFHGEGLGAQLTLAGLDSIARRGVTIGILFVDAGNTAAVGLYTKLGFTVHRTDVAFAGSARPDQREHTEHTGHTGHSERSSA